MRHTLRRALVTAALLLLVGLPSMLSFGCTLGVVPLLQFANPSATSAGRVKPGEALAVTVTFVNIGDADLTPGLTTLEYAGGDDGWTNAALLLKSSAGLRDTATFTGSPVAPMKPGVYTLKWQAFYDGASFGDPITLDVEVTCSDGVFCNGIELFVDGKCTAGTAPCDDGQMCTTDGCDEETGTCSHKLGTSCAACMGSCMPNCTVKLCGDDGCGGSCGTCAAGKACVASTGFCADENQPGTCSNPLPLLPMGEMILGKHVIMGDSTNAFDETIPVCNNTSRAGDVVYTFTTTEKIGIEAQSSGYDTVLSLRSKCLDDPKGTIACSDDAAPPGNYGSRVNAVIDPGTYFLIVDGFDSTQFGPFTLEVRAAKDGCIPNCDGQYCGGDDGCGNDCGSCPAGSSCKNLRCYPDPCVPQCAGRSCGPDGCGNTCGDCAMGELCVLADGSCETFPACDHLTPTCDPDCGAGEFCGVDCACHKAADPQPDLVINSDRLMAEMVFDTVHITPTSCALAEQCVGGMGDRKVLRFSVEAINQGQATLTVPTPAERPDLFTYSDCHGHFHFNGFALYELLDGDGNVVLTGKKQAYCMEDTVQVDQGPGIACTKQFDCSNQGIQAGWSDLYGNALDCQWLDITDTMPGDYTLRITVNPARAFQELSFDNNVATAPVTIQ